MYPPTSPSFGCAFEPEENALGDYIIEGLEEALEDQNVDYRIFGKPFLKSYRRMGVVLAPNLEQAKRAAKKIFVKAI